MTENILREIKTATSFMLDAIIFINSNINKFNEDMYLVDLVLQGKVKIYYKVSVSPKAQVILTHRTDNFENKRYS